MWGECHGQVRWFCIARPYWEIRIRLAVLQRSLLWRVRLPHSYRPPLCLSTSFILDRPRPFRGLGQPKGFEHGPLALGSPA